MPVILPVELLSFTAVPVDNSKVKLNWSTASEINSDYFTVERSRDASTWEYIINVDGSTNSTTTLQYEVWDNQPYMGISYYRLRQTDHSGKFSYSDMVAVDLTAGDDLIVLPNPASHQLTILIGNMQAECLNIFNSAGQLCFSSALEKDASFISIDISDLKPGFYLINLTTVAGNIAGKKIVKM